MRVKVTDIGEGLWKFVRIGTEYRFCDAAFGNHAELLDKGEVADAAGIFSLFAGHYIRMEDWSETLKTSYTGREMNELSFMLNLPVKGRLD